MAVRAGGGRGESGREVMDTGRGSGEAWAEPRHGQQQQWPGQQHPSWAQGEEEAAKGLLTEKAWQTSHPKKRKGESEPRGSQRGALGAGWGAGAQKRREGQADTRAALRPEQGLGGAGGRQGPQPGGSRGTVPPASHSAAAVACPAAPSRLLFCSRGVSVMIRRYLKQR